MVLRTTSDDVDNALSPIDRRLVLQVFNALVDQCAIEKNCLFASKDEAERVCLVGESGRFQVRN